MDLRCQYASTHCPNTRSLKISGELHRFCLFHRRSANAAQRRWKQKKLAETSGLTTSDGDNKTLAATRCRRTRSTTDVTMKAETAAPVATRRRQSREIAAPRAFQSIQQATADIMAMPMYLPAFPVSVDTDVESLPSLFSNDDVSLLAKLVFDADEPSFLFTTGDCWWGHASVHQDVGVIV